MKAELTPDSNLQVKVTSQKGEELVLAVSGRLALETLSRFHTEVTGLLEREKPKKLQVDLAGVDYLDSAGALGLVQFQKESRARSVVVELEHPSERAQGIMSLINEEALEKPPLILERDADNIVEQLGAGSRSFTRDLFESTTFLGALLRALFYGLFHPASVRWQDVAAYMKAVGADGLPIIGLLSFLLGLIIAFMSSVQLKQFGANIYVANLIAIGMVKELGPIMTAILVAGRSGSAFAAEIGTMKVNEEVDALITMGFEPVKFLAFPKALAALMVVPLLTVYADIFGIAGGMMVGMLGLGLTPYAYLKQSQQSLTLVMILVSLLKAGVFALLISAIGCQRGFQVRGGAAAVGSATTSAVVASIFLIIVTDSAFALATQYLGI